MMRKTERKLEKKRKKKGGSNGENLRELEKKRNCPFDAKKVCPVTTEQTKLSARKNSGGFFIVFCN
jgi:hypothetical protein